MPVTASVSGKAACPVWMTKLAKCRPAESLITVTEDASDGRSRDQRTGTSPILGSRSLPPGVIEKRAFRVNRIACLWSLRDRKRGGATFGPLRLPVTEAKNFRYPAFRSASACWSTTADTPPSQARPRCCLGLSQAGRQLAIGDVRQTGSVRVLPGAQRV